jgi:epoxyqueuosine reductase
MADRILIHICCAPCFAAPYLYLKEKNKDFTGFWFNPNIHPYTEYKKRMETLRAFAEAEDFNMIWKDDYSLDDFLRKAAFREESRCEFCYFDRLNYAAVVAKKGNFDTFTSTLLYSKFQNHEKIKQIGESIAKKHGIKFFYADWREFWKDGIKISKEKEMYRQQYCGCIYSERDRYLPKTKRG